MLSALLLLAVQSTPTPRTFAVPYPEGVPVSGPHAPGSPHVLYLNFDGATLTQGNCSSAQTNCTFLIRVATCNFPAYTNNFRKPLIVNLMQQFYAPFNVQVVTTRPTSGAYSMVMIGPGSACVNMPGAAGIGPLDCGDTRDSDITLSFSDAFDGITDTTRAVHNIATTAAQESAHAYGLGHTNDPMDIMYPVVSNVESGFLNKDMLICDYGPNFPQQCGPPPTSDCTGTGHQNSFEFLLADMGPNPNGGPDMTPPTISFIAPHDGDTVPSAFHVAFNASDNVGVKTVDFFIDGSKVGTETSGFAWDIPANTVPAGVHKLKGVASDMAGNTADSGEISVTVRALGDTPGDLGSACTTDADCPGGFCALNNANGHNFCTHVCDPMAADACPSGWACVAAGGTNVCGPAPKSSGGCSMSTSEQPSGGSLATLLIFATCVLQRRRFRSR
jgi:hypothetical protein